MPSTHTHLSESFEALFGAALFSQASDKPSVPLNGIPDEQCQASAPSLGHQYAQLWASACLAIEECARIRNAVRAKERKLFNADDGRRCSVVGSVSEDEVRWEKNKLATSMFDHMVGMASEHCGADGSPVDIDAHELKRQLYGGHAKLDASTFDAVALWNALDAKYGGEAGKTLAWQQLATEFHRQFGLSRQDKVQTKGGFVVLNLRVWIDDFDKKWGSHNRLSYSCAEGTAQALLSLARVAKWASRDHLSAGIERFVADQLNYRCDVESRAQYRLGDKAEVVVVTYLTRFEVRLRQDFAEQLQVFLGTYLKLD